MGNSTDTLEGGVGCELGKSLAVWGREPLTQVKINAIIQGIFQELNAINTQEQLEAFLGKILNDVMLLQSQIDSLTGENQNLDGKKEILSTYLIKLQDTIKAKEKKLDRLFFDKAGKIIDKIRENIGAILTIVGIGGASLGSGYMVIDGYFYTSPEEQILINEQTQKVRSALEATFTRLGITIDEPYEIAGVEFRRRTENVAFSERDFLLEGDFYQLEGEYQGYKLFLAIAFSAPENLIIGLGEVKTELTTPTVSDIETFISEEFQRQEVLRIEKEQEENEQNTILALPENQAIIAEKKEGVRSVIARLSGNENITLSEPFQMKVPLRNIDFYNFEMTPDFGTGNLSDGDYLKKGSEFSITSSKLTFDVDNLSFQIKMTISTDAPYNINLISIDSSGSKGPHDLGTIRNFNGQDVSVFLKELERYFMQE